MDDPFQQLLKSIEQRCEAMGVPCRCNCDVMPESIKMTLFEETPDGPMTTFEREYINGIWVDSMPDIRDEFAR